jgi:hypothetical protein
MIWAITHPVIGGTRMPCDVLIWEQTSANPSRCHDGLLQIFLQGAAYPDGEWVTFGWLLCQAETWEDMTRLLRQHPVHGKRVLLAPAREASRHKELTP